MQLCTVLRGVCGVTVVSVDLCDGSMAPGGRGYQRLHTGLRWRLQMKADFLLSHHPGHTIRHS